MITVIATVLNEGDSINALMLSLLQQTRSADEIIIVDGGSTDNTVTTVQAYSKRLPLRVFVEPGCNISRGRNIALEAARGRIVAVTDAGVRLPEDWLEQLTQPLLDDPEADVACGFFVAEPCNTFEAAMGATVLPLADEIHEESFLPSSRSVAFRREAAQQVGGYPEWLDYCEDLIFDLRLKAAGKRFVFVPGAAVYFRPRPSLGAYFRQYYRYARGDGRADLWRKRHAVRYITYLAVVPGIALLGALLHPLLWLLYLAGGAVYLYQPYRRLPAVMRRSPDRSPLNWLHAAVLIPLLRVVGDVAKMLGYPVGWRWRLRHHPPDWRVINEPQPERV